MAVPMLHKMVLFRRPVSFGDGRGWMGLLGESYIYHHRSVVAIATTSNPLIRLILVCLCHALSALSLLLSLLSGRQDGGGDGDREGDEALEAEELVT